MIVFPLKSERGVALVLVMWALAFLSVLAANFASGMRVQATLTRNGIDQTQAYYAARGGMEIGVARVVQRLDFVRRHGTQNPDQVEKTILPGSSDQEKTEQEVADEQASDIWRVDGRPNNAELQGAALRVYITNEGGKIDLNKSDTAIIRNLLEQWNIDKTDIDVIVDSIADWRDADNMHRQNGAEDDYYQKLDPPYDAKNEDFSSVEELLRVRGISQELLFSVKPESASTSAANKTQKSTTTKKKKSDAASKKKKSGADEDSQEPDEAATEDEPQLRLVDYFTVYNNTGKINLSYAPKAVIRAIPFMTDGLTDRLVELRDEVGPEKLSLSLIRDALGESIYTGVQNYIRVGQGTKEDYFSIASEAVTKGGITAKIKVIAIINSSGNTPAQYIQWIDSVS